MLENMYNLNIERAILSALLFEPALLADVSTKLSAKHLYLPFHQKLYSAMIELDSTGKPIDEEFIKAILIKDNNYDETAFLDILSANPIANVDAYIDDTIEKFLLRELSKIPFDIRKMIEDSKNSEEIKLSIHNKITSLDAQSEIDGDANDLMEEFESYMNDDSPVEYIDTSIKLLNGLFGGGFEKKEVAVIGARPSVGKTSWVTTLISSCINQNIGVLFDSLEMSKLPISRRILSTMSDNPISDLKRKLIKNPTKYKEAFEKIKNSNLIVHTQRGNSSYLKAKARKVLRQNPNIKIWIIDHLGELKYDKNQQLRNEIGDFMSDLRDVAKEFDIAVVVLSQLRRDATNRKPTLADLRESGEIEQKADKVIFLHREDYYDDSEKKKPDFLPTKFIVAKNRDGRVGEVEAYLEAKYTRFVNYELTTEKSNNDKEKYKKF